MKCLVFQCEAQGVRTREDVTAHVARLAQTVRDTCVAEPDIRMVLLPELSSIEYSDEAFEALSELAEPLDGPTVSAFAALAKDTGTTVVFGMPRVDNAGVYRISQVAVGPDGKVIGHYDKVHVAQFGASAEKRWFARGEQVLVFDVEGFRVGVVICYDMRFPGFIQPMVRDHGLDVVLHPVAFTTDGSWPSWPSFVVTRALENQVYWLSVNRAGAEWGHSVLCPPWVDDTVQPQALDTAESLAVIDINRDALTASRETYPFRDDALPDYPGLWR